MKKKPKKAIILAGGKGTRLYPVTLETPKPLLTVNKRPIINYLIDMFKKHGVSEVAITVRASDFEDYSWWLRRWQNVGAQDSSYHQVENLENETSSRRDGEGAGLPTPSRNNEEVGHSQASLQAGEFDRSSASFVAHVPVGTHRSFFLESRPNSVRSTDTSSNPVLLGGVWVNLMVEDEPMGTIGYWAKNLHTWTGDEPFFLTNGDELKDIDLSALTEHHEKHGAAATIAAVEVPNPKEYGVIVFDGDHVDTFLEKPENPPSNFISSGLYLLDPKIREYLLPELEKGEKFLMIEKDLFPKLAKDRKLVAFKSHGKWFDCGNLERWERAIKEWDQK